MSAALAYSPLLTLAARCHQSIRLHRTIFGRRKFTSDVRIPQFWMHILFLSAILHPWSCPCPQLHTSLWHNLQHVTKHRCNSDDIFLVLFAMSFFDTWILIRKRGNIPTSKPLSSPSLTEHAWQMLPAALLMELKREAQIKRCRRRLGDVDAIQSSLLCNRFQQFIAKRVPY